MNIESLKFSLTKFGFHKVAFLLHNYEVGEVLDHLSDVEGDKIDEPQAKKILSSYYNDDKIPVLWSDVKLYGEEDIKDLVFFAIILSHHRLISLVEGSHETENRIYRDNQFINIKEYTNFARSAFELGFLVEESFTGSEYVTLDISRIWFKSYLSDHLFRLINQKLNDAGYSPADGDIYDVILENKINYVFGLPIYDFKEWLGGTLPEFIESIEENRETRPQRNYEKGLKFSQGHSPKFEGEVQLRKSMKPVVSTLIHNRIQTKIFNLLEETFPRDEIGSEISSNNGSVDIVRLSNGEYIFYEIKTANTIRVSIRQAISQLLEYAYWSEIPNVSQLIIVAPNPVTEDAIYYLDRLRAIFGIPLYYQAYNEDTNSLSDLI